VRAAAQHALDSAALAGALQPDAESRAGRANAFFQAQFPVGYLGAAFQPVTVEGDGPPYTFRVAGSVPNLLAPVFGGAAATALPVETVVTQAPVSADVTLVVDASADAGDALHAFTDALFATRAT
jgi:hypothetical protein